MLHLDPDRLARARRSRDLATPEWVRLTQLCESYMGITEPWGVGHLVNYALAGLITGSSRFKNRAIDLAMLHCSRGYDAISHTRTGYGSHGGVREIVPAVACGYDWLYADLTSSQRATLGTWLVNWGNLCWPETQPAHMRQNYGRDHPGDNFYAGFTYAAFAAGLVLTAHGAAEFAESGRDLLGISYRRWEAELLPHKQRYEPDGLPKEGSSYGVQAWMNLLLAMDAIRSFSGSHLWPDAPRLVNQYLLHMTTPDMQRLLLVGDNARITAGKSVTLMPLDDYAKALAWIAQNHVPETGSPTSFAWWLANINPMPPGGWDLWTGVRWRDPDDESQELDADGIPRVNESLLPPFLQLPQGVREHPNYISDPPSAFVGAFDPPSPFQWLAWMPLLFARPELQENGRGERKPMISPGNGFAIAVGSPGGSLPPNRIERSATMLHFQAGQHLEAHEDKAPGSLLIYKDGELIIGSARHWGYQEGLGRDTIYLSTLMLSPRHVSEPAWKADAPEPLKRAHESIRMTRGEEVNGVLYLEADLAGAYAFVGPWNADPEQWVRKPLKRWKRRVIWHRAKDLFVVIDEVESAPWAGQPVIAWQVREKPSLLPDSWLVAVNGYRVKGNLFGSVGGGGSITATAIGNSWRVDTMPLMSPWGGILSIQGLQIRSAAQPLLPAVAYDQGGALGVTFGEGQVAVTLAMQMDDSPPPERERVYITQREGEGQRRFETKAGLLTQVSGEVDGMGRDNQLNVTSYLEDAMPQLSGEVIIIGRESA
jgi:hypothetical protein